MNNSCFPHVINLAAQVILDSLSKGGKDKFTEMLAALDEYIQSLDLDPESSTARDWDRYYQAVYGDVLARARQLVSVFRSSGARRSGLRSTIINGNRAKSWPQTTLEVFNIEVPEELLNGGELLEVQLLRDCETCWSSVFLMVVRILTLWPVS